MFNLDGKVALVIGLGQSGPDGLSIGAACAVAFAKQGAVIFGGNRTVDVIDSVFNISIVD
ncbi:uncharacterized protein LY79DRAFT_674003 [Colletotrichum navitas]|uniref:Uncharacterized protein n=1 Tax=Colletotrichum navitas TaxID=681940 RepID=A0AAD8PMD0_9PEZI|nr:uncharacterized protein LY79DRAFT_674003 [Colletotrichum navitas]KAK1572770.1 hypothetical protein LY79DRAFT_674003 [Colletotrichum navitas]